MRQFRVSIDQLKPGPDLGDKGRSSHCQPRPRRAHQVYSTEPRIKRGQRRTRSDDNVGWGTNSVVSY